MSFEQEFAPQLGGGPAPAPAFFFGTSRHIFRVSSAGIGFKPRKLRYQNCTIKRQLRKHSTLQESQEFSGREVEHVT
jgi:hypothetical protein